MQKEITKKQPLLNEKGEVQNPGYAKKMLFEYDRSKIKANPISIKEWDYYLVTNDDYGVAFTIADNGYLGFVSVSYLDFKQKDYITYSTMTMFPMGKFKMPSTSETGNVVFKDKKISLEYIVEPGRKIIKFEVPKFAKKTSFKGEIVLDRIPEESMVIATPFTKNKKAFYLNQKVNCMRANGHCTLGEKELHFENANAVLDWGRGVWTYDNTWYWGTCSTTIDGIPFGFNIGYGFGDLSHASENMIFYDGKAHKLDQVTFEIEKTKKQKYEYMKEWKFTSNDQRFELTFTPILDRFDKVNLFVLVSDQHQVFGKVNGFVVLDDGRKIEVRDVLASAEVVHNRW